MHLFSFKSKTLDGEFERKTHWQLANSRFGSTPFWLSVGPSWSSKILCFSSINLIKVAGTGRKNNTNEVIWDLDSLRLFSTSLTPPLMVNLDIQLLFRSQNRQLTSWVTCLLRLGDSKSEKVFFQIKVGWFSGTFWFELESITLITWLKGQVSLGLVFCCQ